MNSNFFNNVDTPLIDKFKGIAENMHDFYAFHAVVGYFRSSGYFKLREQLNSAKKIQILVGFNIDSIFRKHDKSLLMLEGEEEAKEHFTKEFVLDVIQAKYSEEVENGILQLCEDLATGKVEMRINKSRNLHAKFYLCLPQSHNENSDGWVIMGSSNISNSGLGVTQPPQYELNVALKNYSDVAYCKEEFDRLWEESVAITPDDIAVVRKKTHLEEILTPYEVFIKALIDAFGDQVEDNFTTRLPDGYMDLKYQKDAVIQGYQMMKEYDGFFLADVVGTGKTIVGTMIAKRFIEENGKGTHVLVVHPPTLAKNWEDTFDDFGIKDYAQFVSNGSLDKVLEGKERYLESKEFDLVIVDEAHGFRSDSAERYDKLQRICKAPRKNEGLLNGLHKKVMLLSATPLNNKPEDFLNLLLLFQDARCPSIDGVSNLTLKFQPWIKKYKEAMRKRFDPNADLTELTKIVDAIYAEMRTEILEKILVRRTRKNLINNHDYKEDLERQGIKFPHIEQPNECIYMMDKSLSRLFYDTMIMLIDTKSDENPNGMGLNYARYRAIEFLTGEARMKYKQAAHVTNLLSAIYRVHMVKRLESSFHAFKASLHTFLRITNDMIRMFEQNQVIIAPDFDVKGMMADMELDEVIKKIEAKGVDTKDFVYWASDFRTNFIDLLRDDAKKLEDLCKAWDGVDVDPKLDKFIELLKGELFDKKRNPTGKLVIFSESVDTLTYLKAELSKRLEREDILFVSASNRKSVLNDINKNFDANYRKGEKLDEYNIMLASDVLAEGVNLHRSNIIVNYDSPWNATRLMQRIGRVNRIGSVADNIYNYMFYPSQEGDQQIKLYQNALLKLQGFHSALGEDAKIYTREEILHDFKLFDENVRDTVDKQLELLRLVRELYATNQALYRKIKSLPPKSRTVRDAKRCGIEVDSETTIVCINKGAKSQYYKVVGKSEPQIIEFVDAAEILRAEPEEKALDLDSVKGVHYRHVDEAFRAYLKEEEESMAAPALQERQHDNSTRAMSLIRALKRAFKNHDVYEKILVLENYVQDGVYNQLTKKLNQLKSKIITMTKDGSRLGDHASEILPVLEKYYDDYYISTDRVKKDEMTQEPIIVISETIE